MNTHIHRVNVN